MARLPRLVVAGNPLHIIQRGNNRSATFRGAKDYRRYQAELLKASQKHGCAIHAYVLMTNHVHLLVTPSDERGPGRMMQTLGRFYVRYFNETYERTGTLWEGRYRSTIVDSESYLLVCSRYIELNPVRALMAIHPGRYTWSSHRHNAYGEPDSLVTEHAVYRALGNASGPRQVAYRALFKKSLEGHAIDDIRRATNRGSALGDEPFCKHLATVLNRPVTRLPHGGDRPRATKTIKGSESLNQGGQSR
jgi:putative transposase